MKQGSVTETLVVQVLHSFLSKFNFYLDFIEGNKIFIVFQNNAVNVWLLRLLVELKKIKAFIWELIDKLSIIMIMLLMLWRGQNNFTFISSAVL